MIKDHFFLNSQACRGGISCFLQILVYELVVLQNHMRNVCRFRAPALEVLVEWVWVGLGNLYSLLWVPPVVLVCACTIQSTSQAP